MLHKVVCRHIQEVLGFLINTLPQVYLGIFQWKNFVNRLRFDRIMAMNLWPHFFGPTLYLVTQLIKCYGLRKHTQPTWYKGENFDCSTAHAPFLLPISFSFFPFSYDLFLPLLFPLPLFPIRFHDPLIRANLSSALPCVAWWRWTCDSKGRGFQSRLRAFR